MLTSISATDKVSSHTGTPNGRRTIIATGEVNGMRESQKAAVPEGLSITNGRHTIAIIMGMVTGRVNCCPSVSASIREPIAPKSEA